MKHALNTYHGRGELTPVSGYQVEVVIGKDGGYDSMPSANVRGRHYYVRARVLRGPGSWKVSDLNVTTTMYTEPRDPSDVASLRDEIERTVTIWARDHGDELDAAEVVHLDCELAAAKKARDSLWRRLEQVKLDIENLADKRRAAVSKAAGSHVA